MRESGWLLRLFPQLGILLWAVATAFGLLVFLFNKIPENLTLISSYLRIFSLIPGFIFHQVHVIVTLLSLYKHFPKPLFTLE